MSKNASHKILTPMEEIIQAQKPAVHAKDVFDKKEENMKEMLDVMR